MDGFFASDINNIFELSVFHSSAVHEYLSAVLFQRKCKNCISLSWVLVVRDFFHPRHGFIVL
ncbi:hypothetical protein CH54_3301 [Yersinia rochesterensis]|uniref:Uncharacterized protein n=1 Tax=Yersinia rochesterensis TaxID=1604335 RepID=A0ABM5STN4_9GAMM|nr:hypothetical protein DJ57_70 [Yersinia rochesterensis]AJI86640.1 hypothetical protein AW19_2486 [Yersinia frederiksenii Y225]AJJ37873.1 hypothetical protein CH54_3301 [Yersinia rochesterensis]CRY65374.1 Uncharacterised protein [Yersinia kristensenii]